MRIEELNTHLLIYIMCDFLRYTKKEIYGDAHLEDNVTKPKELEQAIHTYVEQYVKKSIGTYGVSLLRHELASAL